MARSLPAMRHAGSEIELSRRNLWRAVGHRHQRIPPQLPQLAALPSCRNQNQYRRIFGEGVSPYLDEIDRAIDYSTSRNLAGIIVEPVQGLRRHRAIPEGYMSAPSSGCVPARALHY